MTEVSPRLTCPLNPTNVWCLSGGIDSFGGRPRRFKRTGLGTNAMGLLRTLFLGDIGNYMDIEDTRRDVERAQSTLYDQRVRQRQVDRSQDDRIGALELENEALQASVAALARLLVRKGVVSQAELSTIITALDHHDEPGDLA